MRILQSLPQSVLLTEVLGKIVVLGTALIAQMLRRLSS